MKLRWIGRYDPSNQLLRLCRLMWMRGTVGDGQGYSVKLTLGLRPCLFRFRREFHAWMVTLLGVRLHYQRSYGGRHV